MPAHAVPLAGGTDALVGFHCLREAVLAVLRGPTLSARIYQRRFDVLASQAHVTATGPVWEPSDRTSRTRASTGWPDAAGSPDGVPPDPRRDRMVALVRQAQAGDAEAFGQLYDDYVEGIYRFCYYRVSSVSLAEDLTSETFFRALRSIGSFRWQGRDFGAWLTTIARNLVTDHYRSSRARLETVSSELPERDDLGPGPEDEAITRLTNEALGQALHALSAEQRDCLVMRFLQGLTTAQTAEVLGRSEGAVRQLQLRAVRSLARRLPRGIR
jgi:RNA polymerase sigma-70 factor, ECF subfamily